jgi:hypothetical protein
VPLRRGDVFGSIQVMAETLYLSFRIEAPEVDLFVAKSAASRHLDLDRDFGYDPVTAARDADHVELDEFEAAKDSENSGIAPSPRRACIHGTPAC